MDEPITHPDQITPAWITQVLTANGALIQGQIEKVEFDVNERELSTNVRLKVKYSGESLGRKPDRLFLKMVKADMKTNSLVHPKLTTTLVTTPA